MQRTIEQWANCCPSAMASRQSTVAVTYALADAKADIIELHSLVQRVANLNPDAGEIGAGMLASLIADARKILE